MPSTELVKKELDERGANSLIDFVASTASLVFQQSFDYTTDFPGFIASPTVEPGPFGVAKAIAQQSCRRWARGEGIPSLPGFDAFYGGICEPYLDSLGENPADGALGPDFLGGQCFGIEYRVTTAFTDSFGNPTTNEQLVLSRVVGTYRGSKQPNQTTPVGIELQQNPGGPIVRLNITSLSDDKLGSFRIASVVPTGNVQDNCGNPPVNYTEPQTPGGLPPIAPVIVNIPGIGPVKVDVSFDDDGNINVSLPDLGIDVTVPNPLAKGKDRGEGNGGSGDGDDIPGDQGQPGLPAVGEAGSPAEGGDDDRALVGVFVRTTGTPARANQIFNETETYTKGAYFVYFGGDAGFAQNSEAAITTEEQFFYAPEGANRFRVVPNVGFTILVTPHYERED